MYGKDAFMMLITFLLGPTVTRPNAGGGDHSCQVKGSFISGPMFLPGGVMYTYHPVYPTPPETTKAGGTHSIGMLSCCQYLDQLLTNWLATFTVGGC